MTPDRLGPGTDHVARERSRRGERTLAAPLAGCKPRRGQRYNGAAATCCYDAVRAIEGVTHLEDFDATSTSVEYQAESVAEDASDRYISRALDVRFCCRRRNLPGGRLGRTCDSVFSTVIAG
jgi:hypothetical protein